MALLVLVIGLSPVCKTVRLYEELKTMSDIETKEAAAIEPMTVKGPFVVSANYVDRKSPVKWLVREDSTPSAMAEPTSAVIARDVTFGPSNEYENGWGCSIVANAKSIPSSAHRPFYGLDAKRRECSERPGAIRKHLSVGDRRRCSFTRSSSISYRRNR